jgi:hypothetical protein
MPVHYFGEFEFESVFEFNCLIAFQNNETFNESPHYYPPPHFLPLCVWAQFNPSPQPPPDLSAQCAAAPAALQPVSAFSACAAHRSPACPLAPRPSFSPRARRCSRRHAGPACHPSPTAAGRVCDRVGVAPEANSARHPRRLAPGPRTSTPRGSAL